MRNLEKLTRKKLGEILLEETIIDREQLQKALELQKQSGHPLGKILEDMGVSDRAIAKAVATQFQLPYLATEFHRVDKEVLGLIPPDWLHRYNFVPLDKFGNCLTILMSGIMSQEVVEKIQNLTGCEVFIYIGTTSDVERALKLHVTHQPAQPEIPQDDSWMQIFDEANEEVLKELGKEKDESRLR